jgi:peptidoglycan/LPS O-acetylase OafA/YrhL
MLGLIQSTAAARGPERSARAHDTAATASSPSSSAPLPTLNGYVPALDGLRGVAILLVLLFHATVLPAAHPVDRAVRGLLMNGWMGVDLFFVLSGFLITGILLDARGQEHYFRNFFARRVLRIFPLYYAVIGFYLVIFPRLAPAHAARFGYVEGSAWYYWIYLSNHPIAAATAEPNLWRFHVLDPTWSLAVEEQFYVLWPIVCFLCTRRTLERLCLAIVPVVIGLRVALIAQHVPWGYLNTLAPCRLDSLAIGAFVACGARREGGLAMLCRWVRPAALVAVAALALVACQQRLGFHHGELRYAISYTAIASLAAYLLVMALAAPPSHPVSRLLRRRWLMALGVYSYALYLLHLPLQGVVGAFVYPIDRFLSVHGSRLPGQLIFFALCFALYLPAAWLSWHLFEKHFLKLKRLFPMPRKALPTTTPASSRFAPPSTSRPSALSVPGALPAGGAA